MAQRPMSKLRRFNYLLIEMSDIFSRVISIYQDVSVCQ
jgi:hypothetical protein